MGPPVAVCEHQRMAAGTDSEPHNISPNDWIEHHSVPADRMSRPEPIIPCESPALDRMYISPWKLIGSSNPVPATCFDGSETGLPQGYSKGRRRETLAFSRSVASCGNGFERRELSLSSDLNVARDAWRSDTRCPPEPIPAESLGCLSVSRGGG